MDTKKWWMSKTVWAGVIAVLVAVYNSASTSLATGCEVDGGLCVHLWAIPEWVFGILGAVGVYGRTTASTSIK